MDARDRIAARGLDILNLTTILSNETIATTMIINNVTMTNTTHNYTTPPNTTKKADQSGQVMFFFLLGIFCILMAILLCILCAKSKSLFVLS